MEPNIYKESISVSGFFYGYSAEAALDPYRAVNYCRTDIALGAKLQSS